MAAVKAMSGDVARRFSIDARRVYLTGLSGGARVALQVALGSTSITGVIASAAGYPDSKPRQSVPFLLFATTGTEDFNYVEMRQLDRKLTSPHRLAVFNGGHQLPPPDVALDAIEWLELRGMKCGPIARVTRRSSIGCSRSVNSDRRRGNARGHAARCSTRSSPISRDCTTCRPRPRGSLSLASSRT